MGTFNDDLMSGLDSIEHEQPDSGALDAAPDFMLADSDIAGEPQDASITLLGKIGKMVSQQLEAQALVDQRAEALKEAQKALRQIQEVDLPSLVRDELGIERIDVEDNTGKVRSVEVKEKLAMSIPKSRKGMCAQWLIEHDLSPLVSETIQMSFNPDEKRTAEIIWQQLELLKAVGVQVDPVSEQGMNTASVKAAINAMREKGEDVPLEMFGGHVIRNAVIK